MSGRKPKPHLNADATQDVDADSVSATEGAADHLRVTEADLAAYKRLKEDEDDHDDAGMGVGTAVFSRIYQRVHEIKSKFPDQAMEIETNEWMIRQRLLNIRSMIDKIDHEERELLTVWIVNQFHSMLDEYLVDPKLDREAAAKDHKTRIFRAPTA